MSGGEEKQTAPCWGTGWLQEACLGAIRLLTQPPATLTLNSKHEASQRGS